MRTKKAKSYLGVLCCRNHDYEGTGKTLRSQANRSCYECLKHHNNPKVRRAKLLKSNLNKEPPYESNKEIRNYLIDNNINESIESRLCLTCLKYFTSKGKHNRRCQPCISGDKKQNTRARERLKREKNK